MARQHVLAASYLYSNCRQWKTQCIFCNFLILEYNEVLGHNFGSRHARRSIKSSIDADDHLAFKQSLSHIFGSLDWRPGPVKVGQKFKSTPTLWRPPKRIPNPNEIIFFQIETRKLAESVEQWFLNWGACEVHKGVAKKVKISTKLILTRFYNHPSGQSIMFDYRKCETMYECVDSP